MSDFNGAKLLLTCGADMLVYLRDDKPDIPFPAHWDLPGGGREGQETPIKCALRELDEEFSLHLPPESLRGHAFPSLQMPQMMSWLFTGRITDADIAAIRFGEEGQEWCMMPIAAYLAHPRRIPHFCDWILRSGHTTHQRP
ncbi:NUDIX hydrolase [Paracoccus sp. JM45]|uniref:NUDIX hydrolase n=1 Tax=Paracoccus sp. JM45 TaxID=2283626 RepID=UPI000E6C5A71|nr:NUDIX hydrolase [Paracoccus sp. JM45]RJE79303.1 NUDIX domain-containing protein [Paracoccus sp. JM45]